MITPPSGHNSCKLKNYVSIFIRVDCFHYKKKNHSSTCETMEKPLPNQVPGQNSLTAKPKENRVCHLIVTVKANNVTSSALLSNDATTSYASSYLLSLMKINQSNSSRCIETIIGTTTKHLRLQLHLHLHLHLYLHPGP